MSSPSEHLIERRRMRKLICWIRAVPFFLRSGIWCPHTYKELERHSGIVIAGDTYFRESKGLQHRAGEQVYQNATIITNRCIRCGQTDTGWFNGSEDNIPKL